MARETRAIAAFLLGNSTSDMDISRAVIFNREMIGFCGCQIAESVVGTKESSDISVYCTHQSTTAVIQSYRE